MATRDHGRQAAGAPPGSTQRPTDPVHTPEVSRPLGRRALFGLGAAAGMTATAAAFGTMAPAAQAQTAGTTPGSAPGAAPADAGKADKSDALVEGRDLEIVRFARSVELTLGEVYDTVIEQGNLKSAASDQAYTCRAHHREHAARLAKFAESDVPNSANTGLLATLSAQIKDASDESALIGVLETIEDAAAATYLWALGEASDWQLATVLATIAPVDAQHATAWSLVAADDLAAWAARSNEVLPAAQGTQGRWDPGVYPVSAA